MLAATPCRPLKIWTYTRTFHHSGGAAALESLSHQLAKVWAGELMPAGNLTDPAAPMAWQEEPYVHLALTRGEPWVRPANQPNLFWVAINDGVTPARDMGPLQRPNLLLEAIYSQPSSLPGVPMLNFCLPPSACQLADQAAQPAAASREGWLVVLGECVTAAKPILWDRLNDLAARAQRCQKKLRIITSPRTGLPLELELREKFGQQQKIGLYLWTRVKNRAMSQFRVQHNFDNPYVDWLRNAEAVWVTPDSIAMLADALTQPVPVAALLPLASLETHFPWAIRAWRYAQQAHWVSEWNPDADATMAVNLPLLRPPPTEWSALAQKITKYLQEHAPLAARPVNMSDGLGHAPAP